MPDKHLETTATQSSVEKPYDSRPETRAHIWRVRDFLDLAINNLHRRKDAHDASKLVSPELEAFDIATPKLAGMEYGSEEYKQSLRDLGPALQHHFEHNDHHPEHYDNGCAGMSLMALIEMLCDWRAASERVKQRTDDPEKVKTFESGLAFNQERFGYSDELAGILLNTARELGMLAPASPASAGRQEELPGGLIHQPTNREMGVDAPDFGAARASAVPSARVGEQSDE